MAEATPMGSVVRAGSFKKTGSFRRNSSKVGRSAEPREVNSAEDLLLALLQDMGPLTLEEVEDGVVLPEQIEAHSIEIRAPKPHVQFFEFCARLSTSRLTSLSITDCQAGPKQAEALGRGISTKMQLKRLVLRGNCIMSEGALLLSRAIAGNEHLRSLDLDDNGIGPDVPKGLFKNLPKLEALNLFGNQIKVFPEELLDTLSPRLTVVDLRSNDLNQESRGITRWPKTWLIGNQKDDGLDHPFPPALDAIQKKTLL